MKWSNILIDSYSVQTQIELVFFVTITTGFITVAPAEAHLALVKTHSYHYRYIGSWFSWYSCPNSTCTWCLSNTFCHILINLVRYDFTWSVIIIQIPIRKTSASGANIVVIFIKTIPILGTISEDENESDWTKKYSALNKPWDQYLWLVVVVLTFKVWKITAEPFGRRISMLPLHKSRLLQQVCIRFTQRTVRTIIWFCNCEAMFALSLNLSDFVGQI
jgi:hypothetical protein